MVESAVPVSVEWLDSRLRGSDALRSGSVAGVTARTGDAHNSRVLHLDLTYTSDAPANAPSALVLKRMSKGWGELEVAFYQRAAALLPPGLVPQCIDCAFDEATGESHLLLVDVSAEYQPLVRRAALLSGQGVPAPTALDSAVRALARFHATFWGHPAIAISDPFMIRPWFSDADSFERLLARRHREWTDALGIAPGALGTTAAVYERALADMPLVWADGLGERIERRRHLTLLHGDCYLTQLFVDRTGTRVLLIDFDSVSGGPPAFDLVYLLATFWSRDQRVEHEGLALRAYHSELVAQGVTGYSFDDLVAEYRWMLQLMVFDVIADIANGSAPQYWEPKLRCLVDAHADWSHGAPPWL